MQESKENKSFTLANLEDIDIIKDDIEGKILGNRYKVKSFLDKGSHGLVYKVSDIKKQSDTRLVVKI